MTIHGSLSEAEVFCGDAVRRQEIRQNIAWLRLYASTMGSNNWRDMALRIERQLDKLEAAIGNSSNPPEKS